MANEYYLDWYDNAAKSAATANSDPRIVLLPRSIDTTSTSLTLYGKGAPYYGEGLQENILRLLDNFYGTTAPLHATPGQFWFDANTDVLRVYNKDKQWVSVIDTTTDEVKRAGDTMYGFLTLHADPVDGMHAATKRYLDEQIELLRVYFDERLGGSGTNSRWSLHVRDFELIADTTDQTKFAFATGNGVTLTQNNSLIFVNGVKQLRNSFTITANVLTLSEGIDLNSELSALHFLPGVSSAGTTGGIVSVEHQESVAVGGETFLTVPTYIVGDNTLLLYINGVKQVSGIVYTETNSSKITFASPLNEGDIIDVVVITLDATSVIHRYTFVPEINTNTIDMPIPYHYVTPRDNFNTFAVVYLNGVKQGLSAVTETDGTSITIGSEITLNDIVEIYVYEIAQPAI